MMHTVRNQLHQHHNCRSMSKLTADFEVFRSLFGVVAISRSEWLFPSKKNLVQVAHPRINYELTFTTNALIGQSWTRRLSVLTGIKAQLPTPPLYQSSGRLSAELLSMYSLAFSYYSCLGDSRSSLGDSLCDWFWSVWHSHPHFSAAVIKVNVYTRSYLDKTQIRIYWCHSIFIYL